ncbi:MAG: D-Ala-D-Ala carboxypeptidase family metallohydrolase [Leptolyngbyaceae cyanobacterium MO_188.B28]|nr:D-Ala-D-Ala carboxypeptidase family metallohydrolase [Leptolyngbyaceae cyanobacterium MO_188.B28]
MSNLKEAAINLIARKATDIQLDDIVRQLQGLPPRPEGDEPLKKLFGYIEAEKGSSAAIESQRPSGYDPTQPIDWSNNNAKISKYFTVGEVTQQDPRRIPKGDVIKQVLKLALELDKVREAWGKPLGVTSWYRPEAINFAVGGSTYSQHIQGHAADIYPIGGDTYEFQDWLDSRWGDALGYGAARGFVHVDMRDGVGFNGQYGSVRWNY